MDNNSEIADPVVLLARMMLRTFIRPTLETAPRSVGVIQIRERDFAAIATLLEIIAQG